MARTAFSNIAWSVSALAWVGFWIVLLVSGDRHDHKALVVTLFVVGLPAQLGYVWSALRSRRRHADDAPVQTP